MISFLISALKIIFLLGFLILIHEAGHFFVAKLFKVKVHEFAIGFGPKILAKQGKETKYELRLIPLGGFVRLEGEETRSEDKRAFNNASIPKRMAIVAAGGAVNIVFGILVYFIIMSAMGNNVSTVVDSTISEFAAEQYGIYSGDKIEKINGRNINTKADIDEILKKSNGEEITIQLERNNEEKEIKLTPTKKEIKSTGIYVASNANGKNATQVVQVDKNSAAEKAGIKANDIVVKFNGEEVEGESDKLIQAIQNCKENKVEVEIIRDGENLKTNIELDLIQTYYLGINFKLAENNFSNNVYYAFFETGDFLGSILENLKMLFTGKVGIDQMMGPVGISSVVSQTTGIVDFLYMLAIISISLGFTNLLPIPALDGGKLLILLIEAIRRKPMKEELEIGIQMVGFIILISLSIFISYKDILRIF